MSNTDRNSSKLPSHEVFVTREVPGRERKRWTKIGAAWQHEDGKGFNILLEAHPIGNQIVIRERREEDQNQDPGRRDDDIPF
jgi:hypothetical protein